MGNTGKVGVDNIDLGELNAGTVILRKKGQDQGRLIDISLGLTDKAIARRRYLSERGVQNRVRELYAKLSIDIEQIVDERWGSTYSPRARAISIAMQRGLINADELAGETEALQEWLQRENAMPT